MLTNRSWRWLRSAVVLTCLLSTAQGGNNMNDNNTIDSSGYEFSETQARDRVCEFLETEGESKPRDEMRTILGSPSVDSHPNLGPYYVFNGELGEFWVSCNRGSLIAWFAPGRLTVSEAELLVKDFLKRHIPDFESRNFEQVYSQMDEPHWKEEWEEKPQRPQEQAIFENWATVTVDMESRRVTKFSCSDLRHTRTSPPKISEAEARQIILKQYPMAQFVSLNLMEDTVDGGENWRTIWYAVFVPERDEETPRKLMSIDADTGEIVP